jgi:acyl-CoA reductase-like NAD-dependent aldehyde dehydrogenase
MRRVRVLRWGKPYESLEQLRLVNFETGQDLGLLDMANSALVQRDLRQADRARRVLRELNADDTFRLLRKAAELYRYGATRLPDGEQQTVEEFVACQSGTTGLPHRLCLANMDKNYYVLTHLAEILTSLTRGVGVEVFRRGFGPGPSGELISFQAQSPVLGAVLPNNSPGVHALWLPVLALGIGLVLKPGSQEPWTPYRILGALMEAGFPPEAFAFYPGGPEVSTAILASVNRSMIFGGSTTVEQYRGNPRVQVHGPGYSKILIGDDQVDRWHDYMNIFEESILANAGRSCINCSGIWLSRHGRDLAHALAERLAQVEPQPMASPVAVLAAYTDAEQARQIQQYLERQLARGGCEEVTAQYRKGPRLLDRGTYAFLLPTVVYCRSPEAPLANEEFLFPFVSIVECPQSQMLAAIGPTLVCTAITQDGTFQQELLDCPFIDRLNFGPIPTTQIDWRQPHEGNLVEFLFRQRAVQRWARPCEAD